jgi:myosin-6
MGQTVQKLKKDKETSQKDIQKLKEELSNGIRTIKQNQKISEKDIEKIYLDLLAKCESLIKVLTKRVESEKDAEEQERARKIKEEMDRQKREREEQEKLKLQEEENRKKKAEIEVQRKKEEAEMAAKMKNQKNGFTQTDDLLEGYTAASEQEKRDTELAFRLAQESNATMEYQEPLKRSNFLANSKAGKKHDLSGWKYSELRDTINTSCDVELLEACREEFHRRLKVYHAWKAKNKGGPKSTVEMDERAPKSVYQHQQMHKPSDSPIPPAVNGVLPQRYFRVPFTKDGQNKGLWFAHFDGPYICRQMEVHSGKPPVLLIAGRDDMNMCELKLNETGLTRQRGAEILEYDFEKEWDRNGGQPYVRPSDRSGPAAHK